MTTSTDLVTVIAGTLPSSVASLEPPQLESQSALVPTLLEAVWTDSVVATTVSEA